MKVTFAIALLLPAFLAAPSEKHPQLVDEGRIVGGKNATIEEFPYAVSLQVFTSHSCGGSILSKTKILTAAHCVDSQISRSIRAGSIRFDSGGQFIAVASFVQHPQYSRQTLDFDVAVLTLASPLEFNDAVQPISLARIHSKPAVGTEITVVGWGSTSEGGALPPQLQMVTKPIVSNEDCARAYQHGDSPSPTR